jgi:hypothetical protein
MVEAMKPITYFSNPRLPGTENCPIAMSFVMFEVIALLIMKNRLF